MSDLIQLVYASRATFATHEDSAHVEPQVARILTQSRRNNRPREIGGVLCYGDGCFFQCLEGERDEVETLYRRLHDDPRHRDVTLLLKRPIQAREFKLWAMKYLSIDAAVSAVLRSAGLNRFDPFRFDDCTTERMLQSLREATENQPTGSGDRRPSPPRKRDARPLVYLGAGAVITTLTVLAILLLGLV